MTADSGGNRLDLGTDQRVELLSSHGLRIERDQQDGGVPGVLPGQTAHQGQQILEAFRGVAEEAGKSYCHMSPASCGLQHFELPSDRIHSLQQAGDSTGLMLCDCVLAAPQVSQTFAHMPLRFCLSVELQMTGLGPFVAALYASGLVIRPDKA